MNPFDVIADEMTATQFSYVCPHCEKRHYHGNCLDPVTNRIESRHSHCLKGGREINIKIDSSITKRLKRN